MDNACCYGDCTRPIARVVRRDAARAAFTCEDPSHWGLFAALWPGAHVSSVSFEAPIITAPFFGAGGRLRCLLRAGDFLVTSDRGPELVTRVVESGSTLVAHLNDGTIRPFASAAMAYAVERNHRRYVSCVIG